jgi:NAD(P)-dependent dehydrogenase (short-subunit alcohol dehydrogenase family)
MSFKFPESFRLDGKVALISGVGPTNSRSFALAMAEAGASVCLVARTPTVAQPLAQELRDRGVGAMHIEADLTQPDQVTAVVDATVKELGRIDILFNHVGGSGATLDVVDLPYEEWRRVFAANLDSMFLCTQAAAKEMIEQGQGGSIINTGSTASRCTMPKLTSYSVAKAAVEQFTRCMSYELAPHNIRVNCIRLGTFENAGPIMTKFSPDFGDWFLREMPMHRWGKADEAAAAGLFLASSASSYITGVVLPVSGGFSVL